MTTDVSHAGAIYPTWTLGDRIRKARAISGLDQRQFAEALDVKPGSLAGWETDRQKPRDVVNVARRIEALTHVPAEWILGLTSGPEGGDESLLTGSNRRPLAYKVAATPDHVIKVDFTRPAPHEITELPGIAA